MKTFMIPVFIAVLLPFISPQTPSSAADLDARVQAYLDAQRGQLRLGHFSDPDGRLLYNMIKEILR